MRIHLAVIGVLAGALTARADWALTGHLNDRNPLCSPPTPLNAREPGERGGHLRCETGRIAATIDYGASRSAAFCSLITAIEASDTVVYLQNGRCPEGLRSCLQLLSSVNGTRYLRLRLDAWQPTSSVVRQLAHEFQHVVEIAGAPEVEDQRGLEQMYEQIGFRTRSGATKPCWETREALDVEEQVNREVLSNHRVVAPSYFGVWTLNREKSRFGSNSESGDFIRIHRDQGYGLISVITESRDGSSTRERRAFVLKLDGRDYLMSRRNEEREFVAMTPIDSLTLSSVIRRNGEVVASGIESVSRDGRTLTVKTCAIGEKRVPIKSITIWEKTGS